MITTVILDYGHVLAYPKTGNWFITQNTKKILGIFNYINLMLNYKKMNKSFRTAQKYLDENHLLHTEQEEYIQFIQFYSIFFKEMGFRKNMQIICEKLANDIVYNDEKVSFYDDVLSGINDLKQNYKVVILSDTWPSLRRVLENKGILQLLDGLVMSCDYGETKETTKLFEIAISTLSLIPQECIFVDDSESNLENAKKVGFVPFLMDRNDKAPMSKYPKVKDMNDVVFCKSHHFIH